MGWDGDGGGGRDDLRHLKKSNERDGETRFEQFCVPRKEKKKKRPGAGVGLYVSFPRKCFIYLFVLHFFDHCAFASGSPSLEPGKPTVTESRCKTPSSSSPLTPYMDGISEPNYF